MTNQPVTDEELGVLRDLYRDAATHEGTTRVPQGNAEQTADALDELAKRRTEVVKATTGAAGAINESNYPSDLFVRRAEGPEVVIKSADLPVLVSNIREALAENA